MSHAMLLEKGYEVYGVVRRSSTFNTERLDRIYQDPHVRNKPNFNLTLSGGYNNSAVITTYKAAILSAALRLTQRVTKPTTLIYSFSYRRVSVNAATLQVSLPEIPLLAQPVRVGGPGLTYIRDTRDVPLDAHHGTFNTGEIFLSDGKFGSQANFARVDMSNSSYYDFGRDHWVIARQTRYGQERSFGNGDEQLIPLPERLYAGGATSHNVFWQIGSSATLGTNTTFAGTIMAQASISLNTGGTLNGRALARTGAVTLISNTVNVPSCP